MKKKKWKENENGHRFLFPLSILIILSVIYLSVIFIIFAEKKTK